MSTRDIFDYIIYGVIAVGSILAVRRLYQDLTRPLPEENWHTTQSTDQNREQPK